MVPTSTNGLHIRIEANLNTSSQSNRHIRGVYLRSPWQLAALGAVLRAGRLRNRRIDAFSATYEAIFPAVFDGDMTVIWRDAIPIPAHFPSKSGRLRATCRLLPCTYRSARALLIGVRVVSPPDRHCGRALKAAFHRNAGAIRPAPGRSALLLIGVANLLAIPVHNQNRGRSLFNGLFVPLNQPLYPILYMYH